MFCDITGISIPEPKCLNPSHAIIEKVSQSNREALECVLKDPRVIAANGEGRGMGWTPAQHARTALSKVEFELRRPRGDEARLT